VDLYQRDRSAEHSHHAIDPMSLVPEEFRMRIICPSVGSVLGLASAATWQRITASNVMFLRDRRDASRLPTPRSSCTAFGLSRVRTRSYSRIWREEPVELQRCLAHREIYSADNASNPNSSLQARRKTIPFRDYKQDHQTTGLCDCKSLMTPEASIDG
jgi:hypothetical protein